MGYPLKIRECDPMRAWIRKTGPYRGDGDAELDEGRVKWRTLPPALKFGLY